MDFKSKISNKFKKILLSRFFSDSKNDSQLTIVGVGPGGKDLLTIAALKAINSASVISFPVSMEGGESLAAQIASEWLPDNKKKLPLLFPMVLEEEPRKSAWSKACDELVDVIQSGEKVVFLSQGDISFFSSGSYILLGMRSKYPECKVKLIPGITSFAAAAAIAEWPLALQKEQLLILPAPDDPKVLQDVLKESFSSQRGIVLMKIGKRWEWIRPMLEKMGLLQNALFAEKVGLSDQKILKASDLNAESMPYFSLLLIRQNWPEVLP